MLSCFWRNTSNSYACRYSLLHAPFIENALFFPMYILSTSVENQSAVYNFSILFYSSYVSVLCQYNATLITIVL